MTSVPNSCDCGGQLFNSIWGVRPQNADEPLEDGNKTMRREGFECAECGAIQLTRAIPVDHADADGLDLPAAADRDLYSEGEQ